MCPTDHHTGLAQTAVKIKLHLEGPTLYHHSQSVSINYDLYFQKLDVEFIIQNNRLVNVTL